MKHIASESWKVLEYFSCFCCGLIRLTTVIHRLVLQLNIRSSESAC